MRHHRALIGRVGAVLALVGGVAGVAAATAPSVGAASQPFTADGTFTVPAGVTCVTFEAFGGNSGAASRRPAAAPRPSARR